MCFTDVTWVISIQKEPGAMTTHRERFRAVLRGELPDRIPVVCRLNIWHQTRQYQDDFPEEVRGKSLEQLQLDLGMGISARIGHPPLQMSAETEGTGEDDSAPGPQIFRMVYRKPVRHVHWREGKELCDEWRTPKGTLRMMRRFGDHDEDRGIQPMIREFPIKTLDDYALYEEVIRHRVYEPAYDGYRAFDQKLGDHGLPLVILHEIPFHDLMLSWTGYENGYLNLMDAPDIVEHAVETANAKYREMWEVVADSPCELVMHGVHFDTSITPVPIFEKYFLPYAKAFNERMHQAGKWTAFHGDANLAQLLNLIVEAGYDVADCLATEPLVDCPFQKTRERWGDRITIWGGVPSTLLESTYRDEDLQNHLEMLLKTAAPGKHFICGIADQAMPPGLYSRIQQMANFVTTHGQCPL